MKSFVHFHAPGVTPAPTDVCLVIQGDRLLAAGPNMADAIDLPRVAAVAHLNDQVGEPLHVGLIDGQPIWLCAVGSAEIAPPSGLEWRETRALLSAFTPAQWQAVSCARALLWWRQRHCFCGACGTPTIEMADERARRCPRCEATFFPVVSTAVIVAIIRGDELLLAHNRNFRPGLFSLLAGFVDPGETLEQAAVREVREEVGIEIDCLQYVTSQPWAFPNSLMLGFQARHRSGEILVDGREIEQAAWFRRDAMPEIPRVGTVARRMIDHWLQG